MSDFLDFAESFRSNPQVARNFLYGHIYGQVLICVWSYTLGYRHVWSYMVMYGRVWSSIYMYNYALLYMAIDGHVWMYIYSHV